MIKCKLVLLVGVVTASALTSCTMLPAGPAPGTVGFYEIKAVPNRIVSEDVRVRKLSTKGDAVFVYRVNEDFYSLGVGKSAAESVPKPIDEAATGVSVTAESAKKLAAYIQKVIAQYDVKDKKSSVYLDFKVHSTEPPEYITLRFQYSYNEGAGENAEITNMYLGGGVKKIEYNDLKILLSNLQKN